jgi:hypothetical protein
MQEKNPRVSTDPWVNEILASFQPGSEETSGVKKFLSLPESVETLGVVKYLKLHL